MKDTTKNIVDKLSRKFEQLQDYENEWIKVSDLPQILEAETGEMKEEIEELTARNIELKEICDEVHQLNKESDIQIENLQLRNDRLKAANDVYRELMGTTRLKMIGEIYAAKIIRCELPIYIPSVEMQKAITEVDQLIAMAQGKGVEGD